MIGNWYGLYITHNHFHQRYRARFQTATVEHDPDLDTYEPKLQASIESDAGTYGHRFLNLISSGNFHG